MPIATRLTRRPRHLTTTEQVEMQVKDALPRVRARIDHDPEAALRDSLVAGELTRRHKNLADDRAVFRFNIENTRDMFARNDEKMNRRLGIDVPEDHHVIVLIDDVGFDFSADDTA